MKLKQLFLLVWPIAVQLECVYNLEHGDQKITEESANDYQTLFEKAESSITSLKQNLDEIKQSVAEKLTLCQHYDASASFVTFREQLNALLDNVHHEVKNKGKTTGEPKVEPTKEPRYLRDCADVYKQQSQNCGVYKIQPLGTEPFEVYCDMTTDGGGWTVFQKRGDFPGNPHDYFYRGWQEYKDGFGDLKKEFWIGLTRISLMTKPEHGYQTLRVDLTDLDKNKAYAQYKNFTVHGEDQQFRISFGNYSGNAGDAMKAYNNNRKFSTHDRDNDGARCPVDRSGAWWYGACAESNLNGFNLKSKHTVKYNGIYWSSFKAFNYSLSETEMKIRPTDWTPKTI